MLTSYKDIDVCLLGNYFEPRYLCQHAFCGIHRWESEHKRESRW